MTLSDFGPNLTLLSKPMNWVIVAFSAVLLFALLHLIFRDGNSKGDIL